MGRQPSIERAPRLLRQESQVVIVSSDDDGEKSQHDESHFKHQSVQAPENAPTTKRQASSTEDVPRLLGQERALMIAQTFSEKDGQKTSKMKFHVKERCMAAAENAPMIRTPTSSSENPPRDPEAGIPRGIYKWGLRWGGW